MCWFNPSVYRLNLNHPGRILQAATMYMYVKDRRAGVQDPSVINDPVILLLSCKVLFPDSPLQNVVNLLILSLSSCCCLNGYHGYIHILKEH